MTDFEHWRYHQEAQAILAAVAAEARGERWEEGCVPMPAESVRWIKMHPKTFAGLVDAERREAARAS